MAKKTKITTSDADPNDTGIGNGPDKTGIRLGTPLNTIMNFKYAWVQIVAAAWNDSELTKDLLNEDGRRKPKEYQNWIHDLFENYQGSIPRDLDLTVVKPDPKDKWNPRDRRWDLKNANVELPLPPAPEADQQAIALANYEAIGRSYPLSCCC